MRPGGLGPHRQQRAGGSSPAQKQLARHPLGIARLPNPPLPSKSQLNPAFNLLVRNAD